MPAMLRMEDPVRLCQANVGRGADKAKFRRNIAKVKRAAGARAVICFEEIDEADVPNEMDDIHWMFRWTHKIIGDGTSVPILVPKRYDTFGHRVRVGSPGLAKFTPHRPINRIGITLPISNRVRSELGVTSLDVYGFGFHIPISRPQTQELRDNMVKAVLEETTEVRELGYSGWWSADTNWRKARDGALPRMAPTEVKVIGGAIGTHAEIDVSKAWAGRNSGLRVVSRNARTIDLTIDGHNGHIKDVLWLPRAA